jgi:hypothetical protein
VLAKAAQSSKKSASIFGRLCKGISSLHRRGKLSNGQAVLPKTEKSSLGRKPAPPAGSSAAGVEARPICGPIIGTITLRPRLSLSLEARAPPNGADSAGVGPDNEPPQHEARRTCSRDRRGNLRITARVASISRRRH